MHRYYCENCGAALDPCEICDCQREETEAVKVLTMDDWRKAGSFDKLAKPGDVVEEAIVEEFRNIIPPVNNGRRVMQCGEPYEHRYDPERDRWRATYTTFKLEAGYWFYCGHCFLGKTIEPEKFVGATT